MRTSLNKILAFSIIIITAIGLLVSLFFLIQIWRQRLPVTEKLLTTVKQTDKFLGTTESGLDIIEQVVINVYSSTNALEDSTDTLAQTLRNSNQFIGTIGNFMGEGLINTITNTQTAINSAQASAVVIDNILTTMSKIPFIGIDYNPSRPLSVALGEVSSSLDPIQNTLLGFETNLKTTQANLQEFDTELLVLNRDIATIKTNLKSAQAVIDDYQLRIDSLQAWMDKAVSNLPGWTRTIAWILTIIILWLILIQVAILLQAVDAVAGRTGIKGPPAYPIDNSP